MMLSRTGWDRTPLSVAARPVRAGGHHGDVPRVRPTGGPHLLLLLLLLVRHYCGRAITAVPVCVKPEAGEVGSYPDLTPRLQRTLPIRTAGHVLEPVLQQVNGRQHLRRKTGLQLRWAEAAGRGGREAEGRGPEAGGRREAGLL